MMLKYIKENFFETEEKKTLVSNIFSLVILQGANYLLPLLTVPYLVRVLGPEYFGLLAFSTATIMYFMLITDYGFNLSATQQVSINRDNIAKINEIFSSVMMIKISLMLVSFVLMSILVFSFEKFSQHWQVYFVTFGVVVGQVLFPIWLFQGMERMKYITYLNIGAKLFFTGCIFIFVKEKSDYLLVPLLTALGFIVAGIWSLYIVKKEFSVNFKLQSWERIRFQLINGWHVFFSSLAISMYTISTTFILGVFAGNTTVGYFAAADKIVQAVKGLYLPVSQAIYPLIGKKINEDKAAGLVFINKVIGAVSFGMFFTSLLLFLLAEPIVNILLGGQYYQSILLLKIMAFLPLIISLGNIFGIQAMLNLGYKKEFTLFVLVAALVGILTALVLTPLYEAIGVSIAVLIVELLITVMLGLFFYWNMRKGTL
ncbi:flippase [Thalassolituus oleivorans]|uniref:flippase n=1 Tax=Thalassolituus oleivorans TaxID=187493 RepID=UPI0023F00A0E|nr:flippase [Thalassolituus oleivorans]